MASGQITVVIPTFRRPDKLARLLAALVPQLESHPGCAIVVVNDASHDASYAAALAPYEGRVTYLVRETNGGPGAARNTGARSVASGYLAFTDDDCVPPPHWLGRLAALIAANPDVGVIGGYARPLPRARPCFVERYRAYWRRFPGPTFWSERLHCLATLNLAVRADWFHRVGGFDERFVAAGEDLNLTYRLVLARAPFIVDEAWHTQHDTRDSLAGLVRRYARYAHGAGAHERLTGELGMASPSLRAAFRRAATPLRRRAPEGPPPRGVDAPEPRAATRVLFALIEALIVFVTARTQARGFRSAPAGAAPKSAAPAPRPVPAPVPAPSPAAAPSVTIVFTQREYFSRTGETLDALCRSTTVPYRLVAVDGGSPAPIRELLRREAAARGFEVLRVEHFLSPQAARRMGLARVETPYVVFLENDTVVEPGWLEALLTCAEETGAAAVGPLYCQARRIGRHIVEGAARPLGGERRIVHMAGGEAHFDRGAEGPVFVERHYFVEQPLDEVAPLLRREETEMVEFHCLLARTEFVRAHELLDAAMPNGATHIDFCLAARAKGGAIWIEPRAVAVNVPPARFSWPDLRLYLSQWNTGTNRASLARFREKWGLAADDPFLRDHLAFLTEHRIVMLMPVTERLRRFVGLRAALALEHALDRVLRRLVAARASA